MPTAPHRAPATTIGAAAVDLYPVRSIVSATSPPRPPQSSMRTGAPALSTRPTAELLVRRKALSEAEDVDVVADVPADDRRRLIALVAQDGGRVDLEHPRALLRHRHEDTSGLTSDATSVATRRSARCSVASRPISTSFASGSPSSARSSSAVRGARSVRSMPVVTMTRACRRLRPSACSTTRSSRRPPSLVCQWPTCGLERASSRYARNSPNASRSSGGITKSRASRPSTSSC